MKEEKKILLIHKIVTGVATPEEKRQFDVLNQNVEDRRLINDITLLSSFGTRDNISFDKVKAKAKLFASIEADEKNLTEKNSKVKILSIQKIMSIAAVFIFLIAAMFVFQKLDTVQSNANGVVTKLEILSDSGDDFNSIKLYKLSDLTRIWGDENTKISVAEEQQDNNRVMNLTGNAFFDVSKDNEHPFVINIGEFSVKVLGTSFQIFSDDSGVEVDVYSGVVEFSKRDMNKVVLRKNEGALFDSNRNNFIKINHKDFKLSTKNSYLIFNNASLKDVFERLSVYFDVNINVECLSINDFKGFTSPQYAGDEIEDYFSTIKRLYSLSIKKLENGDYKVTCE